MTSISSSFCASRDVCLLLIDRSHTVIIMTSGPILQSRNDHFLISSLDLDKKIFEILTHRRSFTIGAKTTKHDFSIRKMTVCPKRKTVCQQPMHYLHCNYEKAKVHRDEAH